MMIVHFFIWALESPANAVLAIAISWFYIQIGLMLGNALMKFGEWLVEMITFTATFLWDCVIEYAKVRYRTIWWGRKARSKEEFIKWLREALTALSGMPSGSTLQAANYIYDAQYPENTPPATRVSFGDSDFSWTREAARDLVKADMENWE